MKFIFMFKLLSGNQTKKKMEKEVERS